MTSPVRQGKYAARYEVRPGDDDVAGSGNGERTEALVLRGTRGREGDEQWWAWSTMFASDFSASNSDWNIFTQFHNSGTSGGRVEFYVNGNTLGFTSHGGDLGNPTARNWKIGDKTNGKWYDFVFHVKWSTSNDGFVEVWLDGNKVVPLTNTPTLYVGQDVYLKQGYYREAQSNVARHLRRRHAPGHELRRRRGRVRRLQRSPRRLRHPHQHQPRHPPRPRNLQPRLRHPSRPRPWSPSHRHRSPRPPRPSPRNPHRPRNRLRCRARPRRRSLRLRRRGRPRPHRP